MFPALCEKNATQKSLINKIGKAVIGIKRIIALALLLMILFTGCASAAPASPVTELSGARCTIKCSGLSCTATVTNTLSGITTIGFTSPPSLNGHVYSFTPQGCRITFGDLSLTADNSRLSARALPQLIRDVMKDAASEGALTPAAQPSDSDTAVWEGSAGAVSYTLESDRSTGALISLRVKEPPLTAEFAQ